MQPEVTYCGYTINEEGVPNNNTVETVCAALKGKNGKYKRLGKQLGQSKYMPHPSLCMQSAWHFFQDDCMLSWNRPLY